MSETNDIRRNEDILLEVKDLDVRFYNEEGELRAVQEANFSVRRGRTLGIVGESGCGKSVTAFSIIKLQHPGKIIGGEVLFRGADGSIVDICALDEKDRTLRRIRGGQIGMIFQEPMSALYPLTTIGDQMIEGILLHRDVNKKEARKIAVDMLAGVGIPSPEQRIDQYIHELSGGMRQRVVIALALVCHPGLIIADEPTTALDVTIQAQVLELIKKMQKELSAAVILITHDLAVIAQEADEVAVMYLGRIVEYADVRTIVRNPKHPYTRGLLKSIPNPDSNMERLYQIKGDVPNLNNIPPGCPFHPRCEFAVEGKCDVGGAPPVENIDGHLVACLRHREIEAEKKGEPLSAPSVRPEEGSEIVPQSGNRAETADQMDPDFILEVRGLKKHFPIYSKGFMKRRIGEVKASNDLSFKIRRGETLGLVGESGCGKTTTARTILRALAPSDGQVLFRSKSGIVDLAKLSRSRLKPLRLEMSMIFQDPFGSLNPRMTVGEIVGEPMIIHGVGNRTERRDRVADILIKVGLKAEHAARYPHSFSGGQRQRIGIARALVLQPSLVVADEAVSALDVSVQAQVINLLMDLQKEMGLTYIFVAHDLSVVKHICDDVAVMYAGSIVEIGSTDHIFSNPVHPYTQGLLAAIPHLDPDRKMKYELKGEVLDITRLPAGCPFAPRCKAATEECLKTMPALESHDPFRDVACLNP